MGVLDGFKVNRAIRTLLSDREADDAERRQAVETLERFAEHAVPKLLDELATSQAPARIVEILAPLLSNATLPLFLVGLFATDPRVASRVMEVLHSGHHYDPNRLLDLFRDPEVPKARLFDILSRRKNALRPHAVLALLDSVNKESRTLVLRLVDEVATDALVPELIRRLETGDWPTRVYIARTLRRFSTEASRDALTALLDDQHKTVRQAALEGLAELRIPVDVGAVCRRLRDPELTVQAKAIETVVQINDPQAVYHLLDLLQDESEYVRRAAVEVLNQIGNTDAIKNLLGALRDRDWWVRIRAADALATIGGPKVAEAVLALVKDGDEFIRRCAVEILISSKVRAGGESVLSSLLEALDDPDWWVRERAIDALATLGDRRAVQPLLRVVERDAKAAPVAMRALATIGDPQAIRPLLGQFRSPEKAVRAEAMRAAVALADGGHAQAVRDALLEELRGLSGELREVADRGLRALAAKLGAAAPGADAAPTEVRPMAAPIQSLLHPAGAHVRHASLIAEPERLGPSGAAGPPVDASALEPGTVLAARYRVLRHIGGGAFGVVVLVEDLMVRDEIVLKFLRPHVAADENAIQRFVQELRYARRITHENVIRIHDFIAIGASYAISMEYFPSRSLAAVLAGGILPTGRVLGILLGICRGMGVAHRAGIVHRDLKPANVLLGEEDLVKVVDFGLAAVGARTDAGLTRTGMILGTPFYIAPEQAQGGTVDPRTDIYSLGVIMYEMLTGRPPYTGPEPMAILLQHVQGKRTPPSRIAPGLAPALEAATLKAMAVQPSERYGSMDELGEALAALQKAEGV
jgi:serine/threonine-protein kinase